MTLYDVLEVRTDADDDDIRAAYRQLAKKHHPDKGGSAKKMNALSEAYAVLRDPDLRDAYDRSLARGQRQRAPRAPRPPPSSAPARRKEVRTLSPWEAFLARVGGAAVEGALSEIDRAVSERYAHLPPELRPPSLREILEATADPAPPTRRPRGRGTGTGR